MTLGVAAANAVQIGQGGRNFFMRCFVIVAQKGDKAFRDGKRDAAPDAGVILLRPDF